jgi:hypothetical protein
VWAGARQRIMMSLAYAISFLCFLRIDETLNLETRHIRVLDHQTGKMELLMDFRKTKQTGGMAYLVSSENFVYI